MKRILVFSLLSSTFLVACAPQKSQTVYRAPYGYPEVTEVAPEPGTVSPDAVPGAGIEPAPTPAPTPAASPTPLPKMRQALYGIPEPGKPGFVRSPYNPSAGLLDVRGNPPGTEMKDYYTPGKTFLVP